MPGDRCRRGGLQGILLVAEFLISKQKIDLDSIGAIHYCSETLVKEKAMEVFKQVVIYLFWNKYICFGYPDKVGERWERKSYWEIIAIAMTTSKMPVG